jgi:hypothetical protein
MDERNLENRVPLELLLIPESNSSLSRPSDRSLSNGERRHGLDGEQNSMSVLRAHAVPALVFPAAADGRISSA